MFLPILLSILILFNCSAQEKLQKIILKTRSPYKDIWMLYQGNILKVKETNILNPPKNINNIKIVFSSVKNLELQRDIADQFASTFSNYKINGDFLAFELNYNKHKKEWYVKKIINTNIVDGDAIIFLVNPNHIEIINNSTSRSSYILTLPTVHFKKSNELKASIEENSLAIPDLRQFHANKMPQKLLSQDALTIRLSSKVTK